MKTIKKPFLLILALLGAAVYFGGAALRLAGVSYWGLLMVAGFLCCTSSLYLFCLSNRQVVKSFFQNNQG